MLKKLTILLAALTCIADYPLDAACAPPPSSDREDRSLFGRNRRRNRRAKSDRYRAFNFSNYTQGETVEEVNIEAQGFDGPAAEQNEQTEMQTNYRRSRGRSVKRR